MDNLMGIRRVFLFLLGTFLLIFFRFVSEHKKELEIQQLSRIRCMIRKHFGDNHGNDFFGFVCVAGWDH